MALRARLTTKVGGVFTRVWNRLETGTTCTLVKSSATTDAFETVLAISSKWFFEYSNFRKNFLLEIADDSNEIVEAMSVATHVNINGDVYVIDQGDITRPLGTDVTWKLYCDKIDNREQFATL